MKKDLTFENNNPFQQFSNHPGQALREGFYCHSALFDICEILAKNGEIEKAGEVANTIFIDVFKSEAFLKIVKAWAEADPFKKAIDIANAISTPYCKNKALSNLAKALAKRGPVKKAAKIARIIAEEKDKDLL